MTNDFQFLKSQNSNRFEYSVLSAFELCALKLEFK
jgi:hypothetical protein